MTLMNMWETRYSSADILPKPWPQIQCSPFQERRVVSTIKQISPEVAISRPSFFWPIWVQEEIIRAHVALVSHGPK
jgi:hypothetical protein